MSASDGYIETNYELTPEQRQRLIQVWAKHGVPDIIIYTPSNPRPGSIVLPHPKRSRDSLWAALSLVPSLVLAFWFFGVKFTAAHGPEYWPLSWFFIALWAGLAYSIWMAVSKPPRPGEPKPSAAWWFIAGPLLALATFCAVVVVTS